MRRQRATILGAGAMGTLFAERLATCCDVWLVDIRPELVAAIEARGGVALDDGSVRPARATTDPLRAAASDFLFVFVKAHNTLGALRPYAGQLDPAMPIVSLQNGLGNDRAIKAALGSNVPLALGVTDEYALALGPGHSRRVGIGSTIVGSAGASTETVRAVVELLQSVGLETRSAYDIRPHLWGKLIVNAALNPVAALVDGPNGVVAAGEHAGELARALAAEGAAVARAHHVNLPFADPWAYVRATALASAELRNSLAIDLALGVRTEIDSVNGAIVAAGRRVGVPTPYNEAVLRLVKAREEAQSAR
ncbi:MAG: ketopantoate reductase family protein [Vulcanimicrobiaceae bacterium]